MNVNLCLNSANDSLDTIKYCALYFDHVSISAQKFIYDIQDNLGFAIPLYDTSLEMQTEILSNEKIVTFSDKHTTLSTSKLKQDNEYIEKVSNIADKIIYQKYQLLCGCNLETIDGKLAIKGYNGGMVPISDGEALEAFNNIAGSEAVKSIICDINRKNGVPESLWDLTFVRVLYGYLLQGVLVEMHDGNTVLSNSSIINEMISFIANRNVKMKATLESQQKGVIKNLAAINGIPILLPNLINASIDDILEIRLRANDELIELRAYIDDIVRNIDIENMTGSSDEINQALKKKINPSIRQFESKIANLKINAIQTLLKGIANPFTYSPLLTSVFADIPTQLALALSTSIITFQSLLEYFKGKNELKNNALYFTISLKKYL